MADQRPSPLDLSASNQASSWSSPHKMNFANEKGCFKVSVNSSSSRVRKGVFLGASLHEEVEKLLTCIICSVLSRWWPSVRCNWSVCKVCIVVMDSFNSASFLSYQMWGVPINVWNRIPALRWRKKRLTVFVEVSLTFHPVHSSSSQGFQRTLATQKKKKNHTVNTKYSLIRSFVLVQTWEYTSKHCLKSCNSVFGWFGTVRPTRPKQQTSPWFRLEDSLVTWKLSPQETWCIPSSAFCSREPILYSSLN